MSTEVVLVSGGVDSLLVANAYPDALRLFVDYGQPYAREERIASADLFPGLETVEIRGIVTPPHFDSFVPCRNLMLATIAVQFGDSILFGGMKDDHVEDNKETEFTLMSHVLSRYARKQVRVWSPFFHMTKADAIAAYLKDNPSDKLLRTFSCFNPQLGQECLDCPACLRRNMALHVNRLPSKIVTKDILQIYLQKIHTYDRHRQWTFFNYLNDHLPVVFVDIDGVLTTSGNGLDYENKVPNLKNIEKLKDIDAVRVLWTSRRETDRPVTEAWLARHGVVYHSLLMEKPNFRIFYDDKAKESL